jgi:hypothetical protein
MWSISSISSPREKKIALEFSSDNISYTSGTSEMENSVESLHSDWQYDTWEEEKLKVMIKKAKERHITKKSQIVNQTRYRAFTQSSNVITCLIYDLTLFGYVSFLCFLYHYF